VVGFTPRPLLPRGRAPFTPWIGGYFIKVRSQNIIRVIRSRRVRWVEHATRMGEIRNSYKILIGKYERKRPLGRPTLRWEDNIIMDLKGVGL
jgi:hypothetical protein